MAVCLSVCAPSPLVDIILSYDKVSDTPGNPGNRGLRLRAKFRLDRYILSFCGGEKKPNFCRFLDFGI